jgi:hypothetical protein
MVNVEQSVRRRGWDGSSVVINDIMLDTGLSYGVVDKSLQQLHSEGLVVYHAANQKYGQKSASLVS